MIHGTARAREHRSIPATPYDAKRPFMGDTGLIPESVLQHNVIVKALRAHDQAAMKGLAYGEHAGA